MINYCYCDGILFFITSANDIGVCLVLAPFWGPFVCLSVSSPIKKMIFLNKGASKSTFFGHN